MSDKQKVNCSRMKTDAQTLKEQLTRISKDMEEVQSAMRSLSNCWYGPSWSEYMTKVTEDLERLKKLYESMAKLQKGLVESRSSYLYAEAEVVSKVMMSIVI